LKRNYKMKKMLAVLTVGAFLMAPAFAFATDCQGPECSAKGKIDMEVFAAGGAIDAQGALITMGGPISGAAGSIEAAGGIGAAQAKGGSFFGKVDGKIGVTAGGIVDGDAEVFNPGIGDVSIGVRTYGEGHAAAGGYVDLKALGLSGAEGTFGAAAGEATLSGSIIGPSPLFGWESYGLSLGIAGQGAGAYVAGAAGTALFGCVDVGGTIIMDGSSGSASYRSIDWLGNGFKRETMGTNVQANTTVRSVNLINDVHGISTGGVSGGYVVAGVAASKTIQATNGGVASAKALGTYNGSGELGCSFNGSAVGGTQTTAMTLNGGSGAIMSSSANMAVTVGPAMPN
jgi:hypothetical protein